MIQHLKFWITAQWTSCGWFTIDSKVVSKVFHVIFHWKSGRKVFFRAGNPSKEKKRVICSVPIAKIPYMRLLEALIPWNLGTIYFPVPSRGKSISLSTCTGSPPRKMVTVPDRASQQLTPTATATAKVKMLQTSHTDSGSEEIFDHEESGRARAYIVRIPHKNAAQVRVETTEDEMLEYPSIRIDTGGGQSTDPISNSADMIAWQKSISKLLYAYFLRIMRIFLFTKKIRS